MTERNAAIDSGIVRVFVEGYAPGAPECQTAQFEVFLGEDVERLRERAAVLPVRRQTSDNWANGKPLPIVLEHETT